MGGLAFLGSLAGNVAQGYMNEFFQKRAADYNFDLAENAAQNEYSRQLDFWRRQNDYNDPRAQVARLVSAGLSPVDNVDSGNAQGLSSVPGNDFAKRGAIQPPQIDLINSMKTFAEIRQIGKQGDKIDQEVANLIADQYLKSLEGQLREQGLNKLAEEIASIKLSNDQMRILIDRESRANKYLYTDDYYENEANYKKELLDKLVDEGVITSMDRNYYERMGIHPDRVGSPRDRIITSALDALIKLVSGKKYSLSNFINSSDIPFLF